VKDKMLIYTFWKTESYDTNCPKYIEIPFENLSLLFDRFNGDLEKAIFFWIKDKYPNLEIKFWGDFLEKTREFYSYIDEKSTVFDILDSIFKEDISFYYKLDLSIEILNYLTESNKVFSGIDGVIFKKSQYNLGNILKDLNHDLSKEKETA
jgi:hypothetical protein